MEFPKHKMFKNLLGLKLGRLTVLEYAGPARPEAKSNKMHQWKCKCECGAEKLICGHDLTSGNTISCGCYHRDIMKQQIIDLIGQKFGRLTVIEYVGPARPDRSKKMNHQWRCKCECGNEKIVLGDCLRNGITTSCGCYHKEQTHKAKFINLTGSKFGKWTIVKFSHTDNIGQTYWNCISDSGKEKIMRGGALKYYANNTEKVRKGARESAKRNNARVKAYQRKRREDPKFRLRELMSERIRKALKVRGFSKNGESCLKHLTYTMGQLKLHLESQFEPWMHWNNWGCYNADTWNDSDESTWCWNIDHIKPVKDFNFTHMKDSEFAKCWALSNLRPLSAKQNIREGAR